MKLIPTSIIFAFNPQMPNGRKPKKAYEGDIKKHFEEILNGNGSIHNNHNNLNKFNKLIDALTKSSNSFSFGNLFLTAASTMIDGILHEGTDNIPLIHENESSVVGETTNFYTYIVMGSKPNKKLLAFKNGPTCNTLKKDVFNTKEDFLDTGNKRRLYSKAGANQRNITFFSLKTYLTLGDLKILCDYDEKMRMLTEENYRVKDSQMIKERIKKTESIDIKDIKDKENSEENSEKTIDIKKLKLSQRRKKLRPIKHYSGLLSQVSVLTIHNEMPVYDVKVRLHLVKFHDASLIVETRRLIELLVGEEGVIMWGDTLPEISIKERSKGDNFSHQLVTTLDINVTRLEAFRRRCKVVKSWTRTIPSGGWWQFTLDEQFKNGIYVNRLHHLSRTGIDSDAPASYFLIAEYIGDPRAIVTRIKDQESFHRVRSPLHVAYDFKMDIVHLSKNSESDQILSYQQIQDNHEFLDETLVNDFYPEREEYLNINYNNIVIDKSKAGAEFKLELKSSILETQESNRFEKYIKIISDMGKEVTKEVFKNFTEDDIPFMGDSKDEASKGLRGSRNASQNEDSEDL
jgi:hypothetical protein